MRVYMLPVTVTATLMSAHLALAARVPRVPACTVAQADNAPRSKKPGTPPR